MLGLRIISAIVGIPVLIGIIYWGGFVLAISILLLIVLGTLEFADFIKKQKGNTIILPVILGQFVFIIGGLYKWPYWASLGIGLSLLMILFLSVINYPKYSLTDLSMNLFMLIYVGWSLTHLILLRDLSQGFLFVLLLFLIIWSSDTGAYFAGRLFGKHKLAAKVSPNKTVEGSVGGLLLSIITAIVFNLYFAVFSYQLIIVIAVSLSIVGQLGDLIESAIKRLVDVKDSGNIIPGHGGILDRFDSIIPTAPFFFYLLLLIEKVG